LPALLQNIPSHSSSREAQQLKQGEAEESDDKVDKAAAALTASLRLVALQSLSFLFIGMGWGVFALLALAPGRR